MELFHKIYFEQIDLIAFDNIYQKLNKLFTKYSMDTTYMHIRSVLRYLRLFKYFQFDREHRGIDMILKDITERQNDLVAKGYLFTFIGFYFNINLYKQFENNFINQASVQNIEQLGNIEFDARNLSNFYLIQTYLSVVYFKVGRQQKAVDTIINAFELKNEVVDTTGAGDAFNGALAVALAKDFTYKDAILFANKVAGISTTRLGAAVSMPLLKKVEEY